MDAIGLPEADRRALGDVIARHPQVQRIAGGHMHRAIVADLGGRAVLVAPRTYVQARLDFRTQSLEFEPTAEPAGFAVHTLVDGGLVSHLQPV